LLGVILAPLEATTVKQNLLSPATTDAAPMFLTGLAVTTFFLLTEESISDPETKKASTEKPLGDASKIGDLYGSVYPNAIYWLGMVGHGLFTGHRRSYARARHMFKATLYAGLVATALKYTVREPRPDNNQEKNSFPSGHTTTAFAFATVVAIEHEWYWGLTAMSMAGLTAYSRMNDGRHFLHDVVAGMTIGVSYGLGVYFAEKGQGRMYSFVPILDKETTGIRLVTNF
jgi:membrane-associated phospholipid phosphatase